ncbi:MAG: lipoyl synthase, partial [Actinobacteria bacterium]|nr:lipoyl synthase [Actinomycetota bacterium]
PTLTSGRSASMDDLLRDPPPQTAIVKSDRGGQWTWHGPGQLVAYTVVTLSDDPGAGPAHVCLLENATIEALTEITAGASHFGRLDGKPGVWVLESGASPIKLASVGIRTIRDHSGRRRSLHGIAVNIDCDLTGFADIVACGSAELPVGSLSSLGYQCSLEDFRSVLERVLAGALGAQTRSAAVTQYRRAAEISRRPERSRRLEEAGVDTASALDISERKPEWLRIPANMGEAYLSLKKTVGDLGLVTVCEEAGCPNIYECWQDGTATFMVNGDRCTRNCGFCLVDTRRPNPLDPSEPGRVAEAVAKLGLSHAVVTCVARDDLMDGGAGAIAATIRAIRERSPGVVVEVLISDLKGSRTDLAVILEAEPEVLNHNLETVIRLQRAVRPQADYARSLAVLARAKEAGLKTKSGLMVGLGESMEEVEVALADLAAIGVSMVTVGQYLRPSREHLPVHRYWTPEEFEEIATRGLALGLAHVQSSPLTRSSYHAREASSAVPVTLVKNMPSALSGSTSAIRSL